MWPFSKPEYRVLVLCTANICRSPVAAALLSHHLHGHGLGRRVAVSSAGTEVAVSGARADPRMVTLAAQRGVDLRRHRSRGLDNAQLVSADLILGMEQIHLDAVLSRFPEHAEACGLLDADGRGVADPYFGSKDNVREAFERIDKLCRGRAAELTELLESR